MKNFEEKMKNEAQNVRLTGAEKRHIRGRLEAHMASFPLLPARSPYALFFMPRALAPVLAVLVILIGSGTAYAAQNALPGDLLYPVKIHVNEAVGGALAVSDAAKASWNAGIVQERAIEAEKLASQDKLTPVLAAQVQSSFDSHAAQAAADDSKVGEQNPTEAAELSAQLNGSIEAHSAILAALGTRGADLQTRASAASLADHFEARAAATAGLAPGTERRLESALSVRPQSLALLTGSTTASSGAEASAAAEVGARALQTLSSVEIAYNAVRDTLDASTTADLDLRIVALKASIASGNATSPTSAAHAFEQYRQALQAGVILETYLKADKEYKNNILSPLLRTSFNRFQQQGGEREGDSGKGSSSRDGQDIRNTLIQKILIQPESTGSASTTMRENNETQEKNTGSATNNSSSSSGNSGSANDTGGLQTIISIHFLPSDKAQ